MTVPELRLSQVLRSIASGIDQATREITGLEKVPFVFLCCIADEVQYSANVSREEGARLIKSLLERWQHPEGKVEMPLHQQDDLILRLLVQCKRYHDTLDTAFTLLIGATSDTEHPFMPSQSPLWATMVEGKKIMEATGRAIAVSDALAKEAAAAEAKGEMK